MPKKKIKPSKIMPQNKKMLVIILILVVLLVAAVGVMLFMLLSSSPVNDDVLGADKNNTLQSDNNTDDIEKQPSKDEYGKDNPIIMITDRNTPVLTSEEDGVFTQTAEVNMYCDLQDEYEISSTGKAYKGNKPTTSQMEYENSQTYHKYSQYGSVGLTCMGYGSYRKSDKWGIQAALGHGLKIVSDDAIDDGRFAFTVDAWLNADGSTKEARDFAKKVLMITSNNDTELPTILERYYMEIKFNLNRGAQEFLDNWRKTIDAR